MTAAHTTLLQFLGKKITYDLVVDHTFDSSGYIQCSGTVTGVLLELNGDHHFSVKVDGYDYSELIKFSEIRLKP